MAAQQQEKLAKSSGSSAADFEAQLAKIHSQNQNRVESLEADLLNAQRLAHEQQSSHSAKEEKLLAQISKIESDLDAARQFSEKQLVEAAETLQSAVGRHRAVETELNATIDALFWINHQHVLALVKTIDGTHLNTVHIFTSNASFSNNVSHCKSFFVIVLFQVQ